MRKLILSSILLSSLLGTISISVAAADKLVVYSARNEQLIKHVFDAYRNETGTEISFITDKAAPLLVRLKAEGKRTPADVLITVDAGNLWKAEQDGVLQPLDSKILSKNIPASLRDPDNNWFGMSVRARTIVYHPGRVKASSLSTYEALADPKFKGRLCLRTSKKVYNQSLVAMLIARHGEKKTEAIVRGWVANLATKVFSSDTSVMKAIVAGQCDIGIVNTYYYGRLLKKDPGIKLKLFWPNQKTHGVHVNISGAAVTRYSKHKVAAQKFLEWLSGPTAQRLFADSNMEYPANSSVPANRIVQSWGKFKQDDLNLVQAGKLQAKAVMLMDRAGYK